MSTKSYTPKTDGVDVVLIQEKFEQAIEQDAGVELANYIAAFRELSRFFDMMGTLFATMAADIRDAIRNLEKLRQSPEASHYNTIADILDYESADPATRLEPKRRTGDSGSKTVLHLDRTLEFFIQFLHEMDKLAADDPLSSSAITAYKATLGNYHSWLMSKAAVLAIRTLPTKYQLFERVSKYSYDKSAECSKSMVAAMMKVHDKTQTLFAAKNLNSLPF